jgi:hypothetical protein
MLLLSKATSLYLSFQMSLTALACLCAEFKGCITKVLITRCARVSCAGLAAWQGRVCAAVCFWQEATTETRLWSYDLGLLLVFVVVFHARTPVVTNKGWACGW